MPCVMKRETLISLEVPGPCLILARYHHVQKTATRNGHELGQVGPTQHCVHYQRHDGAVCLAKGQMKGKELKGRARTTERIHRHSLLTDLSSLSSFWTHKNFLPRVITMSKCRGEQLNYGWSCGRKVVIIFLGAHGFGSYDWRRVLEQVVTEVKRILTTTYRIASWSYEGSRSQRTGELHSFAQIEVARDRYIWSIWIEKARSFVHSPCASHFNFWVSRRTYVL